MISPEDDVDLSRDEEDGEPRDLNEVEYQALEQTLIKSLRHLRADANRDKTVGQFDMGTGSSLYYQTLRLYNEKVKYN